VIVTLGSAALLKQLIGNDGLKPARKERKQQEPGSMNISTRPTTRPAYQEQDLSIRKQQEPREPGSMDISKRPSKRGKYNTSKAKRPEGTCKKCSKAMLPQNYGFCQDHRSKK
jgi:hypothetical protein